MKFAVIVFPGSNCDEDAYHAAKDVLGENAEYIWHKDTDLKGADVVILPGGFAHGDYLRTGAMARFSPIMREVRAFADRGGPVLGICNGFQVLLEAGLLPGAMLRNRGLEVPVRAGAPPRGRDRHAVHVGVPAGAGAADADRARRRQLLRRARRHRAPRTEPPGRLPLYQCRRRRSPTRPNPNGSAAAIAGLCNEARNVVGLMPHPGAGVRVDARQRRRTGDL